MATSNLDPGFAMDPANVPPGLRKAIKAVKRTPIDPGFNGGAAAGGLASALSKKTPPVVPGPKPPAARKPAAAAPTGTTGLGASGSQAQAFVTALLQPVIDQIQAAADRRSTAGTAAITGYSNTLARSLANTGLANTTAAYEPTKEQLAASNAAFSDRLQGAGNASADALAGRLASIQAPGATGQAVADLNQNAAGASNASYGIGNAALQGLISNEADARAFANKMPAIAALSGLQGVRSLQSQIAGDTADKLGSLQAQVPGLVQNELAAEAKAKQQAAEFKIVKGANGYYKVANDGSVSPLGVAAPKTGGSSFKIVKGSDGYYRVNPDGTTAPLGINAPAASPGAVKGLQATTVNGRAVTFDPATGSYYIPGTTSPIDPNTLTKPAPKVDKTQLKNARAYVQQQVTGFYASQADPSKPVGAPAIAAAAKAAAMTVGDFLADTPDAAKARADAGIGWNQVPHGRESWPEVQQMYVNLANQLGNARQAFQIVAGTYKEWGKAHKDSYFPKADAAQGAANASRRSPVAYTSVGGVHQTEGLPDYPARDYFAPAGTTVTAPVSGRVVKLSGHDPSEGPVEGPHGPLGWSVYIQASDGSLYYLTHMGSRDVKVGETLTAGQPIGTVANYAKYGTPSHIHMGVHASSRKEV